MLDRRENGTVPLALREGDRSVFSANRLFAKYVGSPKNGPVPNQGVNGYRVGAVDGQALPVILWWPLTTLREKPIEIGAIAVRGLVIDVGRSQITVHVKHEQYCD